MKKTSLILTIFVAILISFLGVYLTDFSNKYYEAHEVYRVYLEGKSIGLINSKKDLEKLIDKEQEKIKLQYNVDKVYIPKGLEIQKETTYSNNIKKEKEIYNDIKDKESFTIEGYKVTIVTTKTTLDEATGEKIEKDVTNYVYILDKNILNDAVDQTVKAFIDEEDYENYRLNKQKEVEEGKEGKIISSIYLKDKITIKKDYISVNENIFTNSKELANYLLFGTTDNLKKYIVKAGDTVSSIADNNKLSVNEFLIANKDINSENTLLYAGKEVVVDTIKPIITLVEETKEQVLQEKEYKTEVVEDPNYYVGYTNIVQNGVPGEELVTRSIKKENGKILDVVTISTVETKAAINRIVKTGSRTQFVIGNTGIWIWPTRSGYVITTYFGHDNGLGYYRYHGAIDIAGLGCNSPIYAANDGTVITAKYNSSLGNYVEINHNNGYITLYGHMSKLLVQKGQGVEMGQVIGLMGDTGYSFGCHLHFQARYNNQIFDPLTLYK